MKNALVVVVVLLFVNCVFGLQLDLDKIFSLDGTWRFEIGDNEQWSQPDFDDRDWEEVYVPSSWEDEGFPGYDGVAWYRKSFKLEKVDEQGTYYLRVGVIDDVDETYINGHLVGFSGGFPPDFSTAAAKQRDYLVPNEYLNFNGINQIAVRVYDAFGPGGIKKGRVGFYKGTSELDMIISLNGFWNFNPGDSLYWKEPDFDDSEWDRIVAPTAWQIAGYKDLHGFAWYRKKFTIDPKYKNERLILLLGKIDDIDETFLNGELIGKTGIISENPKEIRINKWDWMTLRAYYIPRELLKTDSTNTIAVRVFDGPAYGGIYEGPLGIVTREEYLKWHDEHKSKRRDINNFWEWLFGD